MLAFCDWIELDTSSRLDRAWGLNPRVWISADVQTLHVIVQTQDDDRHEHWTGHFQIAWDDIDTFASWWILDAVYDDHYLWDEPDGMDYPLESDGIGEIIEGLIDPAATFVRDRRGDLRILQPEVG